MPTDKITLKRDGSVRRVDPVDLQVGDVVHQDASKDRIPPRVTIGYQHPVYQMPIAAVRREIADGSLFWETTSGAMKTTEEVLLTVRRAPFKILDLGLPITEEI